MVGFCGVVFRAARLGAGRETLIKVQQTPIVVAVCGSSEGKGQKTELTFSFTVVPVSRHPRGAESSAHYYTGGEDSRAKLVAFCLPIFFFSTSES